MANSKISLAALALALLLSLLGSVSATNPATATPDKVKWSRVNVKSKGEEW